MGMIMEQLAKRFPDFPNLQSVEDFVAKITRDMDPLLIIMFGSLPRGDYTFNSDVDILLVFDKQVTWNEVYAYGSGVVQPISKTHEDFLNHLKKGNAFFIQILEEGIVLYSRDEYLEEFKEAAANTIETLKMARVQKGWDDVDGDEDLDDDSDSEENDDDNEDDDLH